MKIKILPVLVVIVIGILVGSPAFAQEKTFRPLLRNRISDSPLILNTRFPAPLKQALSAPVVNPVAVRASVEDTVYTYYSSGRIESKTTINPDSSGNTYYHYKDESFFNDSGFMRGRLDKSRRYAIDSEGCLSHTYTYANALSTRVVAKTGYFDSAWTVGRVTWTYYDNLYNRLESKTGIDKSGNNYYHYIDESVFTAEGYGYGRVDRSNRLTADSDGCLSHSYVYSSALNTRVVTKTGHSDAAWTNTKLTYTYYDNASNRIESKTLAAVDAFGSIYYHYIDEESRRMDKSRRLMADQDGCLSHAYTYSGSSNRVLTRRGYSDENWIRLRVTCSYYDDNLYNRLESKTFNISPDASGNIYYHYTNEAFFNSDGSTYGRVDKSRRYAIDSEGCLSHAYTYANALSTRVVAKTGYFDSAWTVTKVTWTYYNNSSNRLESKTGIDKLGNNYYHYMDEPVFTAEGYSYGRVDKSKRITADSDGCLSHAYTYFASSNQARYKYCYSDTDFTALAVTYEYDIYGKILNRIVNPQTPEDIVTREADLELDQLKAVEARIEAQSGDRRFVNRMAGFSDENVLPIKEEPR